MEPEDLQRVTETNEQRVQRLSDEAHAKYMKAQEDFKASKGWHGWKGLTPFQRRAATLVAVFVIIAIGMLIYNYWDVPQVLTSGEGG